MTQSAGEQYAFGVIFTLLAVVAVAARLYARSAKGVGYSWDDWTIVIATLFTVGLGVCVIYGAADGDLGQHAPQIDGHVNPDDKVVHFQKLSFVVNIVATLAYGFNKLSVLFLYRRIFTKDRFFTILIWCMIGIIIAWTLSFFLSNLLQCVPISANFQGDGVDGHCINEIPMYIGQAYSDVFTDFAILCLPAGMVWRLHMPLKRKVAVTGIFLTGAVVIVTGILKLVSFYNVASDFDADDQDVTWFLTPTIYWPLIEASIGILAACLPTYRPLFGESTPGTWLDRMRSVISLSSLRSNGSRGSHGSRQSGKDGRPETYEEQQAKMGTYKSKKSKFNDLSTTDSYAVHAIGGSIPAGDLEAMRGHPLPEDGVVMTKSFGTTNETESEGRGSWS